MFGPLGYPEVVMILIIAMLLFGPDKIPEIAKFIGKTVRELKRNVDEAKSTIEAEIEDLEIKKEIDIIADDLTEAVKIPGSDIVEEVKSLGKTGKDLENDMKKIIQNDDPYEKD